MTEQVQELINKIKNEGIQAADQKAREIESETQKKSQSIIADAQKEAERVTQDAREEVKKMQESTHMALKQASRDMLLTLRKEVENTLQKIVTAEVSEALSSENLVKIISVVIKSSLDSKKADADIIIALNEKDLKTALSKSKKIRDLLVVKKVNGNKDKKK